MIIRPLILNTNQPNPPTSGYKYFLWYVEEDNNSEYQQQDFALSTDWSDKITGFTCLVKDS